MFTRGIFVLSLRLFGCYFPWQCLWDKHGSQEGWGQTSEGMVQGVLSEPEC